MANTSAKLESMQKVGHSLDFAVRDLQDTLKHANPVEAIVILALIERAAMLRTDAQALGAAINETATEAAAA